MDSLGRHLLIELWDCSSAIDHPESVRAAICEGVREIGATLLHLHIHTFSPQGVTGVATLAESHLALHSWPEHRYLAADVFTCGEHVDPRALVEVLEKWFEPGLVEMKELHRGVRPNVAEGRRGEFELETDPAVCPLTLTLSPKGRGDKTEKDEITPDGGVRHHFPPV